MTLEDDDIPETGAVFTFGKSRFADNTPNKFWIRSERVTVVACGDDHSAFVTENGRLYTFGANEWGQLGIGSSKSTTKPSSVKALKQEGVQSVACGRLHTLVLSKRGNLYTFGAGGEGQLGLGDSEGSEVPRTVQSLAGQTIKQMSCGTDHSLILTDAGVLFSWGGGGEGQLGLGETLESTVPRELDISHSVTQVSCGYYHTAFVTDEGHLYTFGENDVGKLGLGDDYTGSTNIPTLVTGIEGPVHCVSCGNNHTAVIAGDKDLYTFGEGSQGQLGLGPTVLQTSSPQLVTRLKKHQCRTVCCGESHTAVITESGSLYTFGDGRHGKLGQGEESFSNLFIPTRVQRFKGFHVEQVACGGCHTLVRARRKVPDRDPGSSESESEQETLDERTEVGKLGEDLKRIADTIDLNGSLGGTARGRRRQREVSPLPPLARTLPPLGSSTPVTKTKAYDTFSHQTIPTIPSTADKHSKSEPSLNAANTSKKREESEESSYEESEGVDEVDAGTPEDEALDRTYFSSSGNRSDMKRMGSIKRKSKKDTTEAHVDKDNTTTSSVEKLQGTDETAATETAAKPPAVPNKQKENNVPDDDEDDDDESEEDESDDDSDDDDDDDDEEESDNVSESNNENNPDNKNKRVDDDAATEQSQETSSKGADGAAGTSDLEKGHGGATDSSGFTQGQGDGGNKAESGNIQTSVKNVEDDKKSWQFWKKKGPTVGPPDEGSSTDPPTTSGGDQEVNPVAAKATEKPAAPAAKSTDASRSSKACVIL